VRWLATALVGGSLPPKTEMGNRQPRCLLNWAIGRGIIHMSPRGLLEGFPGKKAWIWPLRTSTYSACHAPAGVRPEQSFLSIARFSAAPSGAAFFFSSPPPARPRLARLFPSHKFAAGLGYSRSAS
jgi:hypothetical protein